jgi:hypothetical protein
MKVFRVPSKISHVPTSACVPLICQPCNRYTQNKLNTDNDIAFIYLSYRDQTIDLESTVVENLNNMFPSKNYQSSSKASKYDYNIMICVCVCVCVCARARAQRVYNTFIVFIQTINMISKSKF